LPAHRLVPKLLETGWSDGWPPVTPVGSFLDSIREGNTVAVAALTSMLSPADVAKWALTGSGLLAQARGRMVPIRRRPFSDFAIALARAEAEAEAAMTEVIRETALGETKDSWRAAAWLLDHQAKAAPPEPQQYDDDDELDSLSSAVFNAED
jgi:hypothetical protein